MPTAIGDILHRQTQVRSNSPSSPHYGGLLLSEEPSGSERAQLPSITATQESYPDTGESGETYDLEQLYCVKTRIVGRSSSKDPSHYCDLYPYGAAPYNQWDD